MLGVLRYVAPLEPHPNLDDDAWAPIDAWKVAPHHRGALTSHLHRIGRPWDLLAVTAVLRDRHFVGCAISALTRVADKIAELRLNNFLDSRSAGTWPETALEEMNGKLPKGDFLAVSEPPPTECACCSLNNKGS